MCYVKSNKFDFDKIGVEFEEMYVKIQSQKTMGKEYKQYLNK